MSLTDFMLRPGIGRSGRPVKVRTNYYEATTLPESNIIHYDITITPDCPPPINRRVFQLFEDLFRHSRLDGTLCVYDGRKNMFAPRRLPFGDAVTVDVTLPEDDNTPVSSKRQPRIFKIHIKKVAEIVMEELHLFLEGQAPCTPNVLSAIMALDVLIRHRPSIQYSTVGRSFYVPQNAVSISGGLELWQGYYQSARPTQGRMIINVDVSAGCYFESGSLLDFSIKCLGARSPDDFRRAPITDRDHAKLVKAMKGLSVVVNHRGEYKRRYKIRNVLAMPANRTMFDIGETNEQIDVATYFYKQYNRRLNFPFMPCVEVQKGNFLPMEVCEILPGQRYPRKLNEKQTADMIKFTCQRPDVRSNRIGQGFNILNYRQNEYLQQFGLTIKPEMMVVPARVLKPPSLKYGDGSRPPVFTPDNGVWNLRDKRVVQGASLKAWAVICFESERRLPMPSVQSFIRELTITCNDTGMNIINKTPPIVYGNPMDDIEKIVKDAWYRAGTAAKSQPELILCILPSTATPLYAEIKRVCDTLLGVASQCVQAKHASQAKKQYCANVCLKMNVKLDGANVFLTPDQIPFVTEEPTIIIGADVTHPGPGDLSRPSVATLVGSMDSKASRYAATIRLQGGRTEIIADLANMIIEIMRLFYQFTTIKPKRILFYRDGVSEGQFDEVMKSEILAVRAACESLEPGYQPTITFIVIQKRHHTRFFPQSRNEADRSGNCLPGTVVETQITHPFEFDFYLLSHAGLQGTSRPTHYYVLHDENNFTPDSIQELSYRLCYSYARCTRAVSVVPPAYYAHLVAARARFHARGESWDETSEEEPAGATITYAPVKPPLNQVMYFM